MISMMNQTTHKPIVVSISRSLLSVLVLLTVLIAACAPANCPPTCSEVQLPEADLRGLPLKGSDFSYSNLQNATFAGDAKQGMDLREISFYGANLQGVDFSGANLQGADLRGADLREANLSWVILNDIQIDDQTQLDSKWYLAWQIVNNQLPPDYSLEGADLSHTRLDRADLSHRNLHKVDLQEARLQGTNFRGATITRANLSLANLTGANLTGADLTKTNLRWADARNSVWENANMSWVDGRGAWFHNAEWDGVIFDNIWLTGAVLPDGSRSR